MVEPLTKLIGQTGVAADRLRGTHFFRPILGCPAGYPPVHMPQAAAEAGSEPLLRH